MRSVVGGIAAMVVLCAAGACVSDDVTRGTTDDTVDVQQTSGSLLPWKVGNTWTYQVTGDGEQAWPATTAKVVQSTTARHRPFHGRKRTAFGPSVCRCGGREFSPIVSNTRLAAIRSAGR